ncbi:MAG: DNA polymerase I [Myxococcales bacterium]|nr:DNA polymerase I [Myxococcales bacterium]MCB9577873.1 DNA polymerase I [Polyangiaceae bacterium]
MASKLFDAGAPDVLYLVDLSGYILRAYHALPELTSSRGEPTHATLGTVTMLERLVRERRPALLAVAMDSGRDTFRRELYAEYKAHRPPAPDDLKIQMKRAGELVEAFGIPVLKQKGVEADDLIASAVRDARSHGLRVVILAADKDLMQLVGDDVVMWDTMRDRVFGPPEVEERFGIPVAKLRDLLALMGDSSDNVPGVPHVGPKTARDLLLEYGSLEGVYEHVDEIKKKKLKENLTENKDQAFLSQKLVTLKDDCVIDFDLEALRYGGRDTERLRELYAELDFQRQLSALDSAPEPKPAAPSPPPAPVEQHYGAVVTQAELAELAARIEAAGRVAVSPILAASQKPTSELAGLAFATAPGVASYVPLSLRILGGPAPLSVAEVADALGSALSQQKIQKIAHGLEPLEVALRWNGLPFGAGTLDTEVALYLLDPETRHDLDHAAKRDLGLDLPPREALTKPARGKSFDLDEVDLADATAFAAARADAVLRLADHVRRRIDDEGLAKILDDIERPLSAVLAKMELAGVLVDTQRLAELGKQVEKDLARLEQEAHQIAGKPFNVNSPRQLETLLFDELGLKPLKRTKTSRSTDAATLEALADEHPLPKIILEIRQLSKLKGTYIDALPALVEKKTGRIHTSWEQAVAATGRLSSTDPNLQNIPIRSELGREIRAAFVAPPGHLIVSADYSQIELRVLAHLSEDPVLLDAFRNEQDIHTRTAMEIFQLSPDAVTAEHRRRAKAVNFGIIYGQGESGLAKSLGIPRKEAAEFIAAYFERYQGVRKFMDDTLSGARASDAVHTLLGRRRLIPDIKSGNRARRLAAERIAMNAPIQGTAADLLKLAMLAVAEPVTPGTRMVLTVHDELVFEVPEAEVEDAKKRVKKAMEGVYPLSVPLVVDVGAGDSWKDAH